MSSGGVIVRTLSGQDLLVDENGNFDDLHDYIEYENGVRIKQFFLNFFLTDQGKLYYDDIVNEERHQNLIEAPEPLDFVKILQRSPKNSYYTEREAEFIFAQNGLEVPHEVRINAINNKEEQTENFLQETLLLSEGMSGKIYEIKFTSFSGKYNLYAWKSRLIKDGYGLKIESLQRSKVDPESLKHEYLVLKDHELMMLYIEDSGSLVDDNDYDISRFDLPVKFTKLNLDDISSSLIDENGMLYLFDGPNYAINFDWFDLAQRRDFPSRKLKTDYQLISCNTVTELQDIFEGSSHVAFFSRNGQLEIRNSRNKDLILSHSDVQDVKRIKQSDDSLNILVIRGNDLLLLIETHDEINERHLRSDVLSF